MTEYSIESCVQNTQNIIRELCEAIAVERNLRDCTDEEKDSVQFFLDPDHVLYFTSPTSTSVRCQDIPTIKAGHKPFNALLNADIANTYLSSGELVIASCIANKFGTMVVGVFDRSTGLGLLVNENWVDPEKLADQVTRAVKVDSFEWDILEVIPPFFEDNTPQAARSRDRLNNLLQECKSYTLSKVSGLDIELTED